MKSIWVTWEIQRRNRSISNALGWPLYEIWVNKSRVIRYFKSFCLTVSVLKEERPEVLVVQNPSIILAVCGVLLRRFFRYVLVIDAHNAGIYPSEGQSGILMIVARWLQRKADLTIVTTEKFKRIVEQNGGRGFVLPDALPEVPEHSIFSLDGEINIVNICTFSEDEPYLEIIEAARGIPRNIKIHFTGRFENKIDPTAQPSNVELLGFLSDNKFWAVLDSADFIMDLTLRESCLVCGAYEGVALKKPLILSDTEALRSYFKKGSIYVASDATSIREGIFLAIKEKNRLEKEIHQLKRNLIADWEVRKKEILEVLRKISHTHQLTQYADELTTS